MPSLSTFPKPPTASLYLRLRIKLLRLLATLIRLAFTSRIPAQRVFPSPTHTTPCLVYHPPANQPPTGLYVNFHGGGFAAGSPDADGEFCAFIAREVGCIVVSGGYRLAPEFPYPCGVQDARDVVVWARKTYLPQTAQKVAVGGFSAGATFALGVSQWMARAGTPVSYAAAFYPVMNFHQESKNTLKERNPWIRDLFHEAYLSGLPHDEELLRDPVLSPMYAAVDELPGSVTVVIPEIDPNMPDMREFVRRLEEEVAKNGRGADKQIKGLYLEKCFHGWNLLPERLIGKDRAAKKWEAYRTVADDVRRVFEV
ncbi:Alpha/Beta hydrolase protein [Fimicolochytrium jonesii]|uniref:Alpha/Beta hydrolase protein n=1 Tax=Fimicolochytrium jonesii TaxID=1396493 RepID=UPI0022FE0C93|nr:Alpha/Beta hydrolase protein [Fimicolochytrium jonesii]KAI8824504.1 Alpha/Beta hydrolase protein [Fimicolochytrium jonesii]